MRPLALAVSPHLDDAAFSCGGTLARLASDGWHVVVATLFTRSVPDPKGFALACQLDKGLDATVDYMALRRREDADACARLHVEPRWLEFAEAPHRGYGSASSLFGPILPNDPAAAQLRPALHTLFDDLRPALLLAPQAIGGHVDHVVTVRAIRALALTLPMLWWRDFPYVSRGSAQTPFAVETDTLPEFAVLVPPEPRQSACAAYASQLGFQFGGADRLAAQLAQAGALERFRSERLASIQAMLPAAATDTAM